MDKNSVEATVYSFLESRLRSNIRALTREEPFSAVFPSPSLSDVIRLLHAPDARFGNSPVAMRDELLKRSLQEAVDTAIERLGADMEKWQYGQESVHYIAMRHALSRALNADIRKKLDLGPLPRGGSSTTVNNTGSGNQSSGASFRIIADTGNWDNSVGTNNPGQSGNPENPHYSDLFPMWANGEYFPLVYSRERVESSAEYIIILRPKQ